MPPTASATGRVDGNHYSPNFPQVYGANTPIGAQMSATTGVWVPGDLVRFNNAAPFFQAPMHFQFGASTFLTSRARGAAMHKGAEEIGHGGANLVFPNNANGFFFRSPHQYPGGGLTQCQGGAISSLPNSVSGFISGSPHQNPGAGSMQSNQQKDWRPNTGGSVVAHDLKNLYQPGFVFGYNAQQQIPFLQPEAIPSSMLMQSSMSAHYHHILSPGPMNSCGGSFRELLRNVSSPNCNLQHMQPQVAFTKETTDQMPNVHACANSTCTSDNVGRNDTVNVEYDADDDTEHHIDTDDEEEYYEADGEDSGGIIEEDTIVQGMPNINVNANSADKSTEYEIFPISNHGQGRGKKRRHFPRGYTIPDCRTPRDIGNIEKAMRNAPNRDTIHIFEPKLGMVFDSRAEVYKFYNLYSWEVGFGICFGSFAKNRVNKMRTMQELVCEKEGFDGRCKNNSKRMHCKAMIRLHRTEDLGWYVSKHVTQHNHPLSVSCGEKREWNSHSKIEQCTKDMIRYLRENNVSLSRVHCIMGSLYGSMQDVPFNQKALRAVCSQISRDQKDDDISKTLEVFRKMRAEDPGFQFSVELDNEKKVKTLLWTSGRSRSQYHFFGDAITFDTTYCTNIYKMPFGMFVGVNNHFQSVLFAGVLMTKEDTDSFKWIFTEFITLMGGKYPVTILTDQCKAMTKAIKEVFPDWTTHLWCKWHVLRYAPEELGPVYRRNGPFRRDFHYVINQMLTVDEFEGAWADLLECYNLQDNEFMKRTYAKRHKWAKPWARDTFCARMASTQRSESANSILKKVVPRNSSMNRFVQQYNKLLFLRASAEEKAEHQTKQFVHRTKRIYAIEKHAISVYTKNSFQLFSEEVDKTTQYMVKEGEDDNSYYVTHNNAETRKHWARVVFSVKIEDGGEKYSCECGQYEHFGMLCCHAIKVMIHRGVQEIPQAHIMKRWTRDARDYRYPDNVCTSAGEQLGQSLLYANALDVVKSTVKDPKAGQILTRYLNMARKEIEGLHSEGYTTDGNTTTAYMSESGNETDNIDSTGYDSDGQPVVRNVYGAAGSSAYMSDVDVNQIKAPSVPKESGRKREKRFKPLFERKRKSRKRYTASPMIRENSQDEVHVSNISIGNGCAPSKKTAKKSTKKRNIIE